MKWSISAARFALAVSLAFLSLTPCISRAAASTNIYYVSPSGSDKNDGLSANSPWQTLAKVNASTFQPGDQILFQRGGEWRESLIAPSSGGPGNPITFADYGSGAKPKFWGSVPLDNSKFQPQGGGIYTYPMPTPIYAVLANQVFFYYSNGQPANSVANAWSYGDGRIMINSPRSDPRFDGKAYSAVQRDDVVYSNYKDHLVFKNLVVEESARYDNNGGYAFRIMGSQDVLVTDCEAYHAGKHHFGVINSTRFVGRNLMAAYTAPGMNAVGGASAFVSYGDNSTGLLNQTSEWHNVTADHQEDPQDNTSYYAFFTHGAAMGSVLLDHMRSIGGNISITNDENSSATETITGGFIQNARLEIYGSGISVDGMEINGPQASIDITASNTVLQNMLIHGTNMGGVWYQTAVLSRGTNNTVRFSTIVMDPAAGTNSCIAVTQANSGFRFYGNILLAPLRTFALWEEGLTHTTIAQAESNFYNPNATFSQLIQSPPHWEDNTFAQWQTLGFDGGFLTGNPKFVNASGNDYHLAPGSPAIDAAHLPASLQSSVPRDFDGNPRLQGTAFDMGAFEAPSTIPVTKSGTTTSVNLSNGVLTARVSATAGTPTGTVNFFDGTSMLSTAPLSNGIASAAVSLSMTVAHSITAVYSGDANFNTSTSAPLNVAPTPSKTGSSTSVNLNNGVLTAQVSSTGGTPTGTVSFFDGTSLLSTAPLSNGTASATVSLSTTVAHSITAVYNGDANFNTSTSAPLNVAPAPAKAGTSTSVNLSNGVLTAQVSSTAGTPTGAVSFFDGTSPLRTAPLSSGTASATVSLSTTVAHSITAVYSGDANFNTSTSAPLNVAPAQALDFTFADTSGTYRSVAPGSSTQFTFALTPTQGAYPAPVSFAVTGLPLGSTYTITPPMIATNAGPQTINLSVQTGSTGARGGHPPIIPKHIAWALILVPLAGARSMRRSSKNLPTWVAVMLFSIVGLASTPALTGCGSGKSSPSHASTNYAVTVTATAGTIQHSLSLTLNLQ